MTQYRDEVQAAAQAITSGVGKPKAPGWQKHYSSGYPEASSSTNDGLSAAERAIGHYMTYSRIHGALEPLHMAVLRLKYSVDDTGKPIARDQIAAVEELARLIDTKAGQATRRVWLIKWGSECLRKKYQEPTLVDWDGNSTPEGTLKTWRTKLHKDLSEAHAAALQAVRQILGDGIHPPY